MEPEHQKQRVHDWLDSALGQYGSAEPRTGLEGRIVANLQSASRTPVLTWRPVAAGIAAAMVVAGLVAMNMGSREPRTTEAGNDIVAKRAALPTPATGSAESIPVTVRTSRPAKRAASLARTQQAEPRMGQFPSPQPLSEQEQMLARYVEALPQEAKQLAQAQTELRERDLRSLERLADAKDHSAETLQ